MAPIQTPPRNENRRCTAISELIEAVAEQLESLARILAAVTRLELAIQLKLDLFRDCLCPDAPCSGYQTACTK